MAIYFSDCRFKISLKLIAVTSSLGVWTHVFVKEILMRKDPASYRDSSMASNREANK